jgi:hypothetical protein
LNFKKITILICEIFTAKYFEYLLSSVQFCGTSTSEPPFVQFYFVYGPSSAIAKMYFAYFNRVNIITMYNTECHRMRITLLKLSLFTVIIWDELWEVKALSGSDWAIKVFITRQLESQVQCDCLKLPMASK